MIRNIQYYFGFRVDEGQGVLIAPDTYKEELMNEYHWGKESEYSAFSSFLLPKGSPLKVSCHSHSCQEYTLINNLFPAPGFASK